MPSPVIKFREWSWKHFSRGPRSWESQLDSCTVSKKIMNLHFTSKPNSMGLSFQNKENPMMFQLSSLKLWRKNSDSIRAQNSDCYLDIYGIKFQHREWMGLILVVNIFYFIKRLMRNIVDRISKKMGYTKMLLFIFEYHLKVFCIFFYPMQFLSLIQFK